MRKTCLLIVALVASLALFRCGESDPPKTPDAGTSSGADATTATPGPDASSTTPGPDAATTAGSDAAAAGPDAATAGADASTPDGGLPAPANFTASLSNSCPFTACGGNLLGTWDYTSLCVTSADFVSPIVGTCAGATTKSFAGTGSGRVAFSATHVTRSVQFTGTAVIHLPASCAALGCAIAQQAIVALGGAFASATCADGAPNGCDCTMPVTFTNTGADTYSVAGNRLTVGNDAYDFCVDGTTLTTDDVSTSGAEPGIATLGKR